MKADIVIFYNSGHSVYVIYWFMPKMLPNNDIMMTCTIYPNDSHINQLENSKLEHHVWPTKSVKNPIPGKIKT